MSNVVPISPAAEIAEQVLLRGDLSQLTHAERVRYLVRVCESLGLNPLTKPFEYLQLNGKLVLYALKGATDQLRRIHGVSISVVAQQEAAGLLTVHVRARTADGREDEDFGVVSVPDTLKGDSRANAIMKAITKAKRRVTLSICGLGMLDESELETIPEVAKRAPLSRPRTVAPAPKTRLLEKLSVGEEMNDELPGDLGRPTTYQNDRSAEPSYVDLVEGAR